MGDLPQRAHPHRIHDERKDLVWGYLRSEAKTYATALEETAALIDGFESPFGMELLSTVDRAF